MADRPLVPGVADRLYIVRGRVWLIDNRVWLIDSEGEGVADRP